MSKVKDENQLAEPAHEGFGVLAELVGKKGVTSGPLSGEAELTARAETQCLDSIPSEGNVEIATEVESNAGRRTRSVETSRMFLNAFPNGVYMYTELEDEIAGNLMRLDVAPLQPRPVILQFNGRLI